jgi:hypothetical protein
VRHSSATYIVSDFNVRLYRPDDPHAQQFHSLVAGYGPTHMHRGTVDAVCWRSKSVLSSSALPSSTDSMRRVPVRSWRQLDHDEFRAAVATSPSSRLCRTEDWPVGVDELSALYSDELQWILDVLVPLHASSSKRRPRDPWFGGECRAAKRATRCHERAFVAADRRCQRLVPCSGSDTARQLPPRWRGYLKGDLRGHNSYGAQLINSWVAARLSQAM